MRIIQLITAIILLTGSSLAADLGNQRSIIKTNVQGEMDSGLPDGREGGETIETAWPIAALPFNDTGNTSDNIDDYDVSCPYVGQAKDVVYSFTPATDLSISVDLCGSSYDTKTYIFDASFNILACNDDYYSDVECGVYVSFLEDVPLQAGLTYYIVVDGYGSSNGDYILAIEEYTIPPPCFLQCDGQEEGEPPLHNGYDDLFNTGCNDESGVFPFQTLAGDQNENLLFCGKSGWYENPPGGPYRDTDWFLAEIGSSGLIEWTLDGEQGCLGFLLGPQDCSSVGVLETIEAGPCSPAALTIEGNPGQVVWLWVGPEDYTPPGGFVGHEFNYICNFTGLAHDGAVATDQISFDRLKTLYR